MLSEHLSGQTCVSFDIFVTGMFQHISPSCPIHALPQLAFLTEVKKSFYELSAVMPWYLP